MASEAGNIRGDADMVVVANERRTVDNGSTDKGVGAITGVSACTRCGGSRIREPAGADDGFGEECIERVEVDAILCECLADLTACLEVTRAMRETVTRAAEPLPGQLGRRCLER